MLTYKMAIALQPQMCDVISPYVFGRVSITLGIGPHSSFLSASNMIYSIQNDNCANLCFLLDFHEEGEEVPAYLARGCDRLFKALRAWASDPKLRKVSSHISFLKTQLGI